MVCWRIKSIMTLFAFDVTPLARYALAIVAAHGATDLDRPIEAVCTYLTWALMPIPSRATTWLFSALSIVHFADDGTPVFSVLVHAAVAAVGVLHGKQAAFTAMLAYLAMVHTPRHYGRCARRGRHIALRVAAAATAAALVATAWKKPTTLTLTDLMQRIVIAHVVCEASY